MPSSSLATFRHAAVSAIAVLVGAASTRLIDLVVVALAGPAVAVVALRAPGVLLPPIVLALALGSGVGFLGIPLEQLFVIVIAGTWGIGILQHRWRLNRGHLLLLGFAGWLVLNHVALSPDLPAEVSPRQDLITFLLGLLLCAVAASVAPPARNCIAAIAVTGSLATVAAALAEAGADGRVRALGLNPNFLGLLIALGAVASLHLALRTRTPWWITSTAFSSAGLAATGSRSALIALAGGAFVVAVFRRRRGVQLSFAAAAVVIVMVAPSAIEIVVGSALQARYSEELQLSNDDRAAAALVSVGYVAERPLTGVGYGLFPEQALLDGELASRRNTHNDYLRLAAETGLPGLLLFGMLAMRGLVRPQRDENDRGMQGILVAYLIALVFANSLSSLAVSAGFWLILGIAVNRRYAIVTLPRDTTARIA